VCGAFGTFAHRAYTACLRGQLSSNVRRHIPSFRSYTTKHNLFTRHSSLEDHLKYITRNQRGFAKDIIILILFLGALVYLAAKGLGSIASFDTVVTSASPGQATSVPTADQNTFKNTLRMFGLMSLVSGLVLASMLQMLFANKDKSIGAAAILSAIACAVAAAYSSGVPAIESMNWMIWAIAVLLLFAGIYQLSKSPD
jgi:hypothetical protein